jgi:hypothetical protein
VLKFQKKIFFWVGFFLFLFFLSPLAHAKNPYKKAVKKWTREHEVYQREDFYTSLKWFATLQSDDFIAAKAQEMAQIYEYDGSQHQAYLKKELDQHQPYLSFFVSFYGYDYNNSDISNEKSDWKIQVEVNGERYEPVKIVKIDKLKPLHQRLYPYANLWSRHFFIYFPKPAGADSSQVRLLMNGPFGNDELIW